MNLINEGKMYTWKGASGRKGRVQMCHLNSRKAYNKSKGKLEYCEGEVRILMEYGEDWKWIEHAWNLKNGKVYDVTYGKNDYEYRGWIIKDEYMKMTPKWFMDMMLKHNANPRNKNDLFDIPKAISELNIRVIDEYGKKATK